VVASPDGTPLTSASGGPAGDAPGTVSVVILNYNGRRHLERCLPAVLGDPTVPVEITVVDNGSNDDSVAWLRDGVPDVRVLELRRNLGFGAGNRRGVEAASSAYVALLNNDTVVTPGWLAPLVATLERHPDVAAVCSTLVLLDRPELLNARGGGMTWLGYGFDREWRCAAEPAACEEPGPETEDVMFPTAAAMLVRRAEFLSLGGFDPSFFMYHEDVDFGWRLWLLGKRVVVHRGSVVLHEFGGTTRDLHGLAWRERLIGVGKTWVRHRAWGQMLHCVAWNALHLPGTLVARRRVQRRKQADNLDLLARRIIDPAGFPPPPPELPGAGGPADVATCIPGTSLLPGHDSSAGRLGWGWYPRERVDGELLRDTNGHARAFLRTEAAASGELLVELRHPAAGGRACEVVIACNAARRSFPLDDSAWHELSLPVTAESDGVLDVRIASTRFRPHELRRDWDFRTLGCAVRRIRFRPNAAPTKRERSVSVIIPTFNRAPALLATLEALGRQTAAPLEVIVVDDGSSDDTARRLADRARTGGDGLRLITLHQDNAGPGRARNAGLRHATGELVLFLGDDTRPAPDLVARHVAAHAALGEVAAVIGFTDWDRDGMHVTPFLEYVNRNGEQFGYGLFADGRDVPFTCFYTSNVSLPREVLGEDPFHAEFRRAAWEDAELGYRLSRRGLRIVYCAAARTLHRHPMTMRGFLRRQVAVGEEVETVYSLHPELRTSESMPPYSRPGWLRGIGFAMPLLLPALEALDRRGARLPDRVYRGSVLWAYFRGRTRRRAATAGRVP
jgi:GT2 family glycosyltransferase